MDALSAVFPHLTRETSSGDLRPGASPGDASGEAQGQATFAAALFQFLGGKGQLDAQVRDGDAETRVQEGNAENGVQDSEGSKVEESGVVESGPSPEASEEVAEAGFGAWGSETGGGPHQAGKSEQHASAMGLSRRTEHGVPFSGRISPEGEGEPVEDGSLKSAGDSEPSYSGEVVEGVSLDTGSVLDSSEGTERGPVSQGEVDKGHGPGTDSVRPWSPMGGQASTESSETSPVEVDPPGPQVGSEPATISGPGLVTGERPSVATEGVGSNRADPVPSIHAPEPTLPNATPAPAGPPRDVGDPTPNDRVSESGLRAVDDVAPSPNRDAAPAELAPTVTRELDRLEPEFRERLDRVIQRMQQEYGHQVQVTETYRSPERQESLYSQGRSRPGPVVTWTQSSLHTQGRAADLQVDGSWENPAAYARLQQVAREEGLRTLGSRDAGHVELPTDESAGALEGADSGTVWNREGGVSRRAGTSRVARPAPVPRPASVARPAQVASVARPPRPGSLSFRAPSTAGDAPRQESTQAAQASGDTAEVRMSQGASQWAATDAETPTAQPHRHLREPKDAQPRVAEARMRNAREESRRVAATPEGADTAPRSSVETGPTDRPAPPQSMSAGLGAPANGPQGSSAAGAPGVVGRVDDIQALEEVLNARTPGRIHLELENADGAGTRLRLALRGSELAGTVDVSDPVATERMRARIGELHDALTRKGLDARSLSVQGVRGMESGGRAQADLGSLLQDPLAGLVRVMEGRENGAEGRHHRDGQARSQGDQDRGRSSDTTRQDREKEEQR